MRSRFLLVGLVCVAAGCSSNIVPVSGKVTLDGKPLANATVNFQPVSDSKNPGPGSVGVTDANGEFTLQLSTGKAPGALLGKHKVSITAYEGGKDAPSSAPDMVFQKALVPPRYNTNTELTFEVPAGGSAAANFELKSTPGGEK